MRLLVNITLLADSEKEIEKILNKFSVWKSIENKTIGNNSKH